MVSFLTAGHMILSYMCLKLPFYLMHSHIIPNTIQMGKNLSIDAVSLSKPYRSDFRLIFYLKYSCKNDSNDSEWVWKQLNACHHRIGRLHKWGWPRHSHIRNTIQMAKNLSIDTVSLSKLYRSDFRLIFCLKYACKNDSKTYCRNIYMYQVVIVTTISRSSDRIVLDVS